MSRSLITGIVITLVLIAGLASVFYYNYVKEKEKPLIDAIPNDAAIVIEVKDISHNWNELKHSELWKGLSGNETIAALSTRVNILDSLFKLNTVLEEITAGKKTAISFHRTNHIGMLFVAQCEEGGNWIESLQQTCNSLGYLINRHSFEKETVIDIADKDKNPICSVTLRDHLLICSSDGALVEASIIKLKYHIPNPVRRLENLSTLARNGSDINVYINYATLSNFISDFLRSEYAGLFNYFSRFANWSIFNADINREQFTLKGLTVTDDSLYQYLDLFNTQTPVVSVIDQYLPSNTAYKIQLGFSDYNRFRNDLTEYLQQAGTYPAYINQRDSLEKLYSIDLDHAFENIIGDQAIAGCIESGSMDIAKNAFAMIRVRDVNYARTLFGTYEEKSRKRTVADSLPGLLSQRKRLPFGNFLRFYFGGPFEHITSPYYEIINDIVLFANDPMVLDQLISDIQKGNTIGVNPSFQRFRMSSGDTYNLSFMVNTSMAMQIPANYVNESFYSQLNRYSSHFRMFEFVQVHYAASADNSFYTQISYVFNSGHEDETRLLWKSQLDTTLAIPPVIVRNPDNNQNCILAQDVMNTLYYFSPGGSLIWKTKLTGRILSDIYTIDKDKNGKIGYLFNTATQTCLIDASGNNVYGYPVRFPGKTNYGLLLNDLFSDSTYTWYVSLTNNRIVGYGLDGKALKGWNPRILQARPVSQPRSVLLGITPYIYVTDTNGKPEVFTYSGVESKLSLSPLKKGSEIIIHAQDTSGADLFGTDSAGMLMKFHINSAFQLLDSKQLMPARSVVRSIVYQPGNELYLMLSDTSGFELINPSGVKLVERQWNDTILPQAFLLITPDGKLMIGISYLTGNKINLLDIKGNEYTGFPLEGNSVFSIGSLLPDGIRNLITSDNQNNLRVYRLK